LVERPPRHSSQVAPTCYRVVDLAERWSCSSSKIRTLLRDGVLPTLQIGTMIRIPIAAVVAYETQCQKQTDHASAPEKLGAPTTAAVVALRAARIAQKLKRS